MIESEQLMQGYVTLALDHDRYVQMAINLARSLKFFDRKRPTCIVYNEKVQLPHDIGSVFDHAIMLPSRPGYVGCTNKLCLYEATPFDETMYVDADSLLVKDDIDRHWRRLQGSYFNMTGEKRTSGLWNTLDLGEACQVFSIPYIVQMNSGVFYFVRDPRTARLFARLHELYRNHRQLLSNIHKGQTGQYADEPIFGTAMGEFGIEPLQGSSDEGSWMVTTWRARNCQFDPIRQFSRIDKPRRYWFGVPLLPRDWIAHSPTIAHFIGLKPTRVYRALADFFERSLVAR